MSIKKAHKKSVKEVKRMVTKDFLRSPEMLGMLSPVTEEGVMLGVNHPFVGDDGRDYEKFRIGMTAHKCPVSTCSCVTINVDILCNCEEPTLLGNVQLAVPKDMLLHVGLARDEQSVIH